MGQGTGEITLEEEIRNFLFRLCVDFGICLPPEKNNEIASKESYEVDDFVREVFKSEGLDPDLQLSLYRKVKRSFTDRYGARLNISSLRK